MTADDRGRDAAYDGVVPKQPEVSKKPKRVGRRPWRAKRDEPERRTEAAEIAEQGVRQEAKRQKRRRAGSISEKKDAPGAERRG